MNNIQAFTNRITRAIILATARHGLILPEYGDKSRAAVYQKVRELLEEGSVLQDMLDEQYNRSTGKFACPLTVEQALIVAGSFNAEPMQEFVRAGQNLERAVEICFEQTFYDAMVDEYVEGDSFEDTVVLEFNGRPPKINPDYPGMEVPDVMLKSQAEIMDMAEKGELPPVETKD